MAHLFFSRLLYRWTFGLLVFALVLSGAAILAGKLRHDPMAVLFTHPDGTPCEMPCLFGVRPGETTLEEATALIQSHPATYNLLPISGHVSGTPSGLGWERASVPMLYLGDGGQAVALNFYGTYNDTTHMHEDPLSAVCLHSVFNDSPIVLPPITSELATMWHRSSFLQTVATLGIPQSIGFPIRGSYSEFDYDHFHYYYYNEIATSEEVSYYFDNRLLIMHSVGEYHALDIDNNFLSAICVYENGTAELYSRTTLSHDAEPRYPWLGMPRYPWLGINASLDDYSQWALAHQPTLAPG